MPVVTLNKSVVFSLSQFHIVKMPGCFKFFKKNKFQHKSDMKQLYKCLAFTVLYIVLQMQSVLCLYIQKMENEANLTLQRKIYYQILHCIPTKLKINKTIC